MGKSTSPICSFYHPLDSSMNWTIIVTENIYLKSYSNTLIFIIGRWLQHNNQLLSIRWQWPACFSTYGVESNNIIQSMTLALSNLSLIQLEMVTYLSQTFTVKVWCIAFFGTYCLWVFFWIWISYCVLENHVQMYRFCATLVT